MRVKPYYLIVALEKTIEDLAEDFREKGAFSFATEADVQSTLLGRLRANVLFNITTKQKKIELVHAEFPAFGTSWKGGPRHDLTVWHPDHAEQARDNWGTPVRQWPEKLQKNLNLIAIELKRFAGLPWEIRKYQMFKEDAQALVNQIVKVQPDVRKLKESYCEFAYLLLFWDDDVITNPDLQACFKFMRMSCTQLADEIPKLRIYCICRDGTMFKVVSGRTLSKKG